MLSSPMKRKGTSLKRRSLHEETVDVVRSMIIEGELPEGERIDEVALCDQLEISRTPLREALKVLQSEGLVAIEPNRGARVAKLTQQDFIELFEVISALERQAAELAAERATAAELKRLQRMQTRIEKHFANNERQAYFALNQEIHRSIVAMTHNETLSALHNALLNKASRGRFLAIGFDQHWEQSVKEHRQLLEALEQRDAHLAGQILFAHVKKTGQAALLLKQAE